MRLLIVEDEKKTAQYLNKGLSEHGFIVDIAHNGEDGFHLAQTGNYALIILDIMLPDRDGWSIIRELRRSGKITPIIFLTARDSVDDRVKGLELGADDYITKPFDANEVVARIKAVLRRSTPATNADAVKEVSFDNLSVNLTNYELRVKGEIVDAPPKELELIYHLASNPNRVYTRDQLLDEVWGFEYFGDSRTIDVHVKRLREKLEGVSDKWELKTVWGVGYKFETK